MAPDRGEPTIVAATEPSQENPLHYSTKDSEENNRATSGTAISPDNPKGLEDITNLAITEDRSPSPNSPSIPTHLSHNPATNAKRTDPFQFGQRYLSETDDVFAFNAWDHVTPDPEYEAYATQQYAFQKSNPVNAFTRTQITTQPQKWWDLFYKQKSATFFKDRKWLFQEFPILHDVTRADAGVKRVLEVGAGAGNTAFPILRMNENDGLEVFAYDFSKTAVETMRTSEDYNRDEKVGRVRAEVWDVASTENGGLPPGIEWASVNVVILIFIFSALSPSQWEQAVQNVYKLLKPGGMVLFRDYGRGDLAQVRFKSGRYLDENFYVRGDGTRVYFFEKEEVERIWGGRSDGDQADEDSATADAEYEGRDETITGTRNGNSNTISCSQTTRFDILNLDVDRRLIVNRQRRVKMYRCWLQGRFQKPEIT